LIAAAHACGIETDAVLSSAKHMASHCRREGTWLRLQDPLYRQINDLLPQDAAECCVDGRLTIAVSRLSPEPQLSPWLVSSFQSRSDLAAAILASCYLPCYVGAKPWFDGFRGMRTFDGGWYEIIPPVEGAVRVCCFPRHPVITWRKGDIGPDETPGFPCELKDLWRMCFLPPADDAAVDALFEFGRDAASRWLERTGAEQLGL
jgi:hypothetical protein